MQTLILSAEAKLCCKSKGHCMMGNEAEAKIYPMGQSESAKAIACCQDNCLSWSESSILHSRTHNIHQNLEMSPVPTPVISIDVDIF